MINREISTKNYSSFSNIQCISNGQYVQDLTKATLVFSEIDFIQWCSLMSIELLQSSFKVYYPQGVCYMRKNCHQNNKIWVSQICDLQCLDDQMKNFAINTYKKFIQATLFVSDKDYLDSITFNSDCFLFPNKVYKLLTTCKNISSLLLAYSTPKSQFCNKTQIKQKNSQYQNLIVNIFSFFNQVIKRIENNLQDKIKLKYKHKIKIKNQQQIQALLQQFNNFWRYCCEQERQSIWCLGYNNIRKAASKLIEGERNLDLGQIQEYVLLAQKIGAKQLKQKIFSWKLSRTDNGITAYMQLIFNQILNRLRRNPKQSNKVKNRKQKKRKVKQRLLRRSSIDQSSNQTNQTDIIYDYAFDININEITQTIIQKNIIDLADNINSQANQYYDNRVDAYIRLEHILKCVGVTVKIYGSCCVGLAIKNSDVDITVSETVLNDWFGSTRDTITKITAFFSYLEYYFSNFPWISNIKIIGGATIPIIKFTIDTNIPMTLNPYLKNSSCSLSQMNQSNKPLTQIDLTIQTTEPCRKHLGIISTKQTQQWLSQMSTLQSIVIILKNQLALKNFNESYYGGLNTYTLLVMIIAVIRKNKLQNQTRASITFEKVVKFYSQQFSQQNYGIDLDEPQIFYIKKLQAGQLQINRKLQVKDPQGDHKIITRNCYQFKKIKQIFGELYKIHFIQSRKKIQQLFSIWNPKQNPFDQEMLLNWIQNSMKNNLYIYGLQYSCDIQSQYFCLSQRRKMLKSQ